jgi:hypothetical protein
MAANNDLSGDALVDLEEMQLMEREGNRAPSTQDTTSEKSNNDLTRQGEPPEVEPLGGALPP